MGRHALDVPFDSGPVPVLASESAPRTRPSDVVPAAPAATAAAGPAPVGAPAARPSVAAVLETDAPARPVARPRVPAAAPQPPAVAPVAPRRPVATSGLAPAERRPGQPFAQPRPASLQDAGAFGPKPAGTAFRAEQPGVRPVRAAGRIGAPVELPTIKARGLHTGPIDIVTTTPTAPTPIIGSRRRRRLIAALPVAVVAGCIGGLLVAPAVQASLTDEHSVPAEFGTTTTTGPIDTRTPTGTRPSPTPSGSGASGTAQGTVLQPFGAAVAPGVMAPGTSPLRSASAAAPAPARESPAPTETESGVPASLRPTSPTPSSPTRTSPPSSSATTPASSPAPTSQRPTSSPTSSSAPTSSAPTTSAPSSSAPAPSSAAPSPSASKPVAPPAGVTRSLRAIAADAGSGGVTLPAGTFTMDDFRSDLLGADLNRRLVGEGSDRTVVKMLPKSSSKAGHVPKKAWRTNQLSLLRVEGAKTISGFTLLGTDQDHLYNGLRISRSSGADIDDVRVIAVPGADDIPPGETFGINDFHTNGSTYRNVEVDGNGSGAANFGTNSSANVTIKDSYFHDSGHANGVTFWQTKNVTVKNVRSTGNYDAAFNFERVSGNVLLDHVVMKGNRLADLRINSDQGSARFRIVDPVFSGDKLDILMTPKYMGRKNLQKRSDVQVIIDGVDRTDDVVRWVTHF